MVLEMELIADNDFFQTASMLSWFSHVQLFATLWTLAYQVPSL